MTLQTHAIVSQCWDGFRIAREYQPLMKREKEEENFNEFLWFVIGVLSLHRSNLELYKLNLKRILNK